MDGQECGENEDDGGFMQAKIESARLRPALPLRVNLTPDTDGPIESSVGHASQVVSFDRHPAHSISFKATLEGVRYNYNMVQFRIDPLHESRILYSTFRSSRVYPYLFDFREFS